MEKQNELKVIIKAQVVLDSDEAVIKYIKMRESQKDKDVQHE